MVTQNRARTEILRDTVRRFHHLPSLSIARYLLNLHGPLWDNDLEKIRSAVRYQRGRNGETHRNEIADTSLFQTGPIALPQTWRRKKPKFHLDPGLWLVIADIHVPFHEQMPLEAAVSYGQAEQVNGILILGDFFDYAGIGFWATAHRDFNKELEAGIDTLDWLRQEFPSAQIVYKPGNHEFRLPAYFAQHALELAESPIAAMETVLGFEERKITFLDYYQIVQAGDLPMIHGHEIKTISRAVNPARGLYLKAKTFCACAHCHSTSMHTPKNIHGELLSTWSIGCLCDLEPDYNPFGNDWNWGFALVNVEKGGDFEVVNRRILASGKIV